MSLSANMQITDQDIRSTSTAQGGESLGQVANTADGRSFRYGLNGTGSGTALAPGKLNQVATAVANHVNQTGVTAAVGAASLTYAVGATAVTQDQYKQGYFVVNAGTGVGQTLEIDSNTKANSSGSPIIYFRDTLMIATLASDSKFSLHPHPYSALIIQAATLGAGTAGVANVSVPDTAYAWFQVGGACSVLSDAGTIAIGAPGTYSDDTAGAVGPYETDAVGDVVCYALIATVSAEYRPVYLTIY